MMEPFAIMMCKLRLDTIQEGRALWYILHDKNVCFDNKEIETGSFRMLGTQIAVFCGGDYMDYYCCSPRDGYSFTADNLEFVKKRLQEIKVVLNPIQG